ncbi:hypothetical protein FEE59_16235 [Herbaspirillum sp. RU 5E]|nr:hypothetical protein [Herbaspirillum sp. RU 5E]
MAILAPTCFATGTFIRTKNGDVAIEFLKVGDEVVTAGGLKPIKWIGYRKIDFSALSVQDRLMNRAVLISASAFGKSLPSKDLVISGTHGIVVDRKLIAANNLVNGKTVRAMNKIQKITYFHLEFEDFELILANNIFTESFVDVGNRVHFDNYEEWRSAFDKQSILVPS